VFILVGNGQKKSGEKEGRFAVKKRLLSAPLVKFKVCLPAHITALSRHIPHHAHTTQERSMADTPPPDAERRRHAVVLVLGDVGRSPRMQYHALSLAGEDPAMDVSLVGYRGERCIPAVEEHPRIHLHYVDPFASEALR
jgi:hypothetical protein